MYPIMDPGDTNNPEMPKGTDKKKLKKSLLQPKNLERKKREVSLLYTK